MKKTPLIIFLTTLLVSIASASPIDPRFDGNWVGVETFPTNTRLFHWNGKIPQRRTVISISNSGQTVRVVSGFVPGGYWVSPKSSGTTLIFYGSNGVEGRKECRLELSSDGNTLKEGGITTVHIHRPLVDGITYRPLGAVTTEVYATFHRTGQLPNGSELEAARDKAKK